MKRIKHISCLMAILALLLAGCNDNPGLSEKNLHFKLPEKIIIHRQGQQTVIEKDTGLYVKVIEKANLRIKEPLDIAKLAVMDEDEKQIKEDEIALEFIYPGKVISEFKSYGAKQLKKEYSRLLMPLTGNLTDLLFFGDGERYFDGPLGKLESPEELLSLITESTGNSQAASRLLENMGYDIVADNGKVEEYALKKDDLLRRYQLHWGLQKVNTEEYLGKSIEVFGFIVKNHPLDYIKDNNKKRTKVWIMIDDNEVIGGYSLPDYDTPHFGGVYSLDGKTLEQVTGMEFQEWRKQWEEKVSAYSDKSK